MNTLTINDLAITCDLDRAAMTRVRGGHGAMSPSYGGFTLPVHSSYLPSYSPSYTSTVDVSQSLQQFQNVSNSTANGSAFISGVTANNNTSQFGQNNALIAH
jgi:hypothetical protein